jgi:predicted TIM-barrel fold metal-dependent hydrolase
MSTADLIDAHAHFFTAESGRGDWQQINEGRLEAGAQMGVTAHVASILGTWGATSPTYFPSPDDVTHGNDAMVNLTHDHPALVFGYCVVNPNYPEHALQELRRRVGEGMIGVKLAASRRANDPLLDPIAAFAAEHHLPILHHIWQHRRRDWPGQEASDAVELLELAVRHPDTKFLLAHLGGGGDWAHTLRAACDAPNVWIDLSGSGVDGGMLETALEAVGPARLVWACDVTMDTGLAKLRYLEALGVTADDLGRIRSGNAVELFPEGVFVR